MSSADPPGVGWVHVVVDVDTASLVRSGEFWSRVLGWGLGDPWPDHPELRSFEPARGGAYVHLQEVEGPARVHLDLESVDPRATIATAEAAGAELVAAHDRWVTMLSPGLLPFCVLRGQHTEPAPDPMRWPDGHRSRLVQVCVDSPTSRHEQEVAFWRRVLGGRWVPSPAEEFAGKWHDDDGSPIQLLFQQLEEEEGAVRAHLDLGTDDQPSEVERLLHLGATDLGAGQGGWHVLQDPAGLPCCVTENSPAQLRHRDLG